MNLYGCTLIFQGLCDFFAKPNILTCLDLSSTECPLDLVTTFYNFIINPADQLMHVYHFPWQNAVEKTTTTKQIMTKRNGKNRPIPKTKQTRNKQQKQINTGKSTLKYLDIWWKLVVIDQEMFKEKLNSSRAGKSQDTLIWVQKLRHFGTKVRESGNKHFWSLWSEQIIMYMYQGPPTRI